MSYEMVTKPQMGLLIRLNGGERVKLDEVHTITLASGLRKGILKPTKTLVKITPLGKDAYEFTMNRRITTWKRQLEEARGLKRGKA